MALDRKQIVKTVSKVRKIVQKAAKEPTPENVHNLRTRIRRLEATLHALRLTDGRNESRALELLRGVRKRAGKVRDMDVLTSYASGVHLEAEDECLVRLLEHLGAERYLKSRGPKIRRRLKRTAAHLEEMLESERTGRSEPLLVEETVALRVSGELIDPPVLNRGNLHPYRLKVKELRYLLEMGENEGNKEFVQSLGEVKDAIGEWHDWEELIAIATEATDHPNCKLIQKFKRISQEKYDSGLAAANKMRAVYFQVSSRNRKHKATSNPAPATIAASKVAA